MENIKRKKFGVAGLQPNTYFTRLQVIKKLEQLEH